MQCRSGMSFLTMFLCVALLSGGHCTDPSHDLPPPSEMYIRQPQNNSPQRVQLRLKRDITSIRTEDLIRKIGRGLLDPNILNFFGPLLLAGLVALPFLAPTAILPLAGLMSGVRFGKRRKRDVEDNPSNLASLLVKELPALLDRMAKDTQLQRRQWTLGEGSHPRQVQGQGQLPGQLQGHRQPYRYTENWETLVHRKPHFLKQPAINTEHPDRRFIEVMN